MLQAPISFYSPSDILINDTCAHTYRHTHINRLCAHFYVLFFLSVIGTLAKDLESIPAPTSDDTISLQYVITHVTCSHNTLDIFFKAILVVLVEYVFSFAFNYDTCGKATEMNLLTNLYMYTYV